MKIILVVIAAVLIYAVFTVAADRRKLKQSARALGLDAPGVRAVDCEGLSLRFAVKPEEGAAYVIRDVNASPVRIPLEDLAGCELLDYGERKRTLGRALAGEAAADYLSGHSPLAVLRILRRDPALDAVEYRLTRSTYYDDFRIFAKEVKALVEEYAE
ncbi:MAG: hypothetical protein IKN89_14395 [Oscillospiraceae bacterium]|nr:hypothetical protein [Oscillospiraceae bacterium]